jgi:uncharacterized membrane protein
MDIPKNRISLYLMAAFYILAGLNHFLMTDFYVGIMPGYIPYHLEVVYLSGVAEMGLGLLLLPEITRDWAAWGIIGLLILVFPANVFQFTSGQMSLMAFILRTMVQFLLIIWAYSQAEKK